MTGERVTVSLPARLLGDARATVAGGAAESVSAFVAAALHTQLTRAKALAELERVLGGRALAAGARHRPPGSGPARMIGGRVLDASALVGFAAQSSVYAAALVWTAVEEGVVP
jgi:antitoxin ParD1/3/4